MYDVEGGYADEVVGFEPEDVRAAPETHMISASAAQIAMMSVTASATAASRASAATTADMS